MRETQRIQEKLRQIEDDQTRGEILAAQGVLLDTFAVMTQQARGALSCRKRLAISLDDAKQAADTLIRHIGGMDDQLPQNRKALIAYILRLGREAILPDGGKQSVPVGRTLYAAANEAGAAGVYSSQENAKRAGFTDARRIVPLVLAESSAVPRRYVCMAAGEWTSLQVKDGQCTSQVCPINPVWGFSIQECILAIHRMRLYGVVLKSLYIYEIDRTYPYLLNAADRFETLFHEFARQSVPAQEIPFVDYIQQHFDEMDREAAYIEKYYSEDTLRLLNRIAEEFNLNTKQKAWMRTELCRRLSKEELLETQENLDRVRGCMPRRNRGGQRKKRLKDYLE